MTQGHSSSYSDTPHPGNSSAGVPNYDLTTYDGMVKAAKDYAEQNPKKAAAMGALAIISPFAAATIFAGKKAVDALSNTFKDPAKVIDAQRKAAVDLIKSGKDNGVKKMKVTLDQKAGVDIGGELEGYGMKFSFGSDSKMTIDVEY